MPMGTVFFVVFFGLLFAHWLNREIAICFILICGVAISSGIQTDDR
jgi:hypothetical protein